MDSLSLSLFLLIAIQINIRELQLSIESSDAGTYLALGCFLFSCAQSNTRFHEIIRLRKSYLYNLLVLMLLKVFINHILYTYIYPNPSYVGIYKLYVFNIYDVGL